MLNKTIPKEEKSQNVSQNLVIDQHGESKSFFDEKMGSSLGVTRQPEELNVHAGVINIGIDVKE